MAHVKRYYYYYYSEVKREGRVLTIHMYLLWNYASTSHYTPSWRGREKFYMHFKIIIITAATTTTSISSCSSGISSSKIITYN
jgi:hypothetical protein